MQFRVFAPGTYPGLISGPPDMSSSSDVPVQDIHFTTTTGDMSGVVGKPIIQYHHTDGLGYSDFMRVNFITVGPDYVPNTLQSVGDVVDQNFTPVPTTVILNIPVVPTGATLQNPATKGTTTAPIEPFTVFYKGQEITTYVFEVTDQAAKDFFDPLTRTSGDADFAVTVSQFGISGTNVFSIPLWHVNQFSRGVTAGMGGGPSPDGQRNIINSDRGMPGYSPLWQLFWLTEMPVDYLADQVSHFEDMTADNGFVWATTPMFVNCPDVGAVGTEENSLKLDTYETMIDPSADSNWVIGSDMSLIFQAGVEVMFEASETVVTPLSNDVGTIRETVVATTQTNGMGAYEYELMSSDIPAGATKISVVVDSTVIRTIEVTNAASSEDTSSTSTRGFFMAAVASFAACVAL
jgi:hypothetical protein